MQIIIIALLLVIRECRAKPASIDQCPAKFEGKPNAAFSTSAGCIYADDSESDKFDTFTETLHRCRSE